VSYEKLCNHFFVILFFFFSLLLIIVVFYLTVESHYVAKPQYLHFENTYSIFIDLFELIICQLDFCLEFIGQGCFQTLLTCCSFFFLRPTNQHLLVQGNSRLLS